MKTIFPSFRAIRTLFVLIAFAMLPKLASALPIFVGSPCYFVKPDGTVWIKYELDQTAYGAFTSSCSAPGSSTTVQARLYSSSVSTTSIATSNSLFTATTLFNTGLNSSFFTLPNQVWVEVWYQCRDANNVVIMEQNSSRELLAACGPPSTPPNNSPTSGCFASVNGTPPFTVVGTYVAIDFDPLVEYYYTYYNLVPRLYVNTGTGYGPYYPANYGILGFNSLDMFYNISGLTLDMDQCYDILFDFVDANNSIFSDATIETRICACPRECDSRFTLQIDDDAPFPMFYLTGIPQNSTGFTSSWKIYSGSTLVWSGVSPTLGQTLPYGNYKVCHTSTNSSNEEDFCKTCTEFCYNGPTQEPTADDPGQKNAPGKTKIWQSSTPTTVGKNGENISVNYFSPNSTTLNSVLYNSLGQVMYSEKIDINQGNNTVSHTATGLVPGMYYLVLIDGNGEKTTKKIVIQ